jgi:hypothetical protein
MKQNVTMNERYAVQAERHVREAEEHVRVQSGRIAEMQRRGFDTAEAQRLLDNFSNSLVIVRAHYERIREELRE